MPRVSCEESVGWCATEPSLAVRADEYAALSGGGAMVGENARGA